MDELIVPSTEFILYTTEDGQLKIEVRMEQESVWITQAQMAELFQTTKQNISLHVNNVFKEGELSEISVVKESLTTAADGKEYKTKYYNLDVIISVGYRVKSLRGTQFRIWASNILKEYLIKGFAMNDDALKNAGGGLYWKELLDRIKDIRSSEKVIYRQLIDLFSTSVDYNPKSDDATLFFQTSQNKFHYAAHGFTAAEIIYERADASKPNMGLTNYPKARVRKADTEIAKNCLYENEIKMLNGLVSAFFDIAELHAIRHEHMFMRDWLLELDDFTGRYGGGTLMDSGKVAHKAALEKAHCEYEKFKNLNADTLSAAELDALKTLKETQKQLERKPRMRKKSNDIK